MGPIGCSETSVGNYHYSQRNSPETCSSQCSSWLYKGKEMWETSCVYGTKDLQGSQCTDNVNIEEPSCNHCCSGKAMSVTHSKYVFVALRI